MPEWLIDIIITIVKILVVEITLLTAVAYTVYAERKVSAFTQNRIGPNRVGYKGLLQPLADALKLILKEDIVPAKANKFVHSLAPAISMFVALSTFAVIPFGDKILIAGREIKTISKGMQTHGKYRIYLTTENLSSGTYFYQLIVDGIPETKKMVLVR